MSSLFLFIAFGFFFVALMEQFHFDSLAFRKLVDLEVNTKGLFYEWVRSLTEEQDNEQGIGPGGFEEWLKYHETLKTDTTIVYSFQNSNFDKILGTASIVKKDRAIPAPENGWVLGGIVVSREFRGKGLGRLIVKNLVSELQRRADESESGVVPVILFTDNEIAQKLYSQFGWIKTQDTVPETGTPIFLKNFQRT